MLYLILIILVSGCLQSEINQNRVTSVIDGDTIKISSGETIRFLCVNTPEVGEHGYEEAKEFTSRLLGKDVRLERGEDNRDRFGRLLRIVYFTENGMEYNINSILIEKNLAKPMIFGEEICNFTGN